MKNTLEALFELKSLSVQVDKKEYALESFEETADFLKKNLKSGLDKVGGQILTLHIDNICRQLGVENQTIVPSCESFDDDLTKAPATAIAFEGVINRIKETIIEIYKAIIEFIHRLREYVVDGFSQEFEARRQANINKLEAELNKLKKENKEFEPAEINLTGLSKAFSIDGKADAETVCQHLKNTYLLIKLFNNYEPVMNRIVASLRSGFVDIHGLMRRTSNNEIDGDKLMTRVNRLYEETVDVFEEYCKQNLKSLSASDYEHYLNHNVAGYELYGIESMVDSKTCVILIENNQHGGPSVAVPKLECITKKGNIYPSAIMSPSFGGLGKVIALDQEVFKNSGQKLAMVAEIYNRQLKEIETILGVLINNYDNFHDSDRVREDSVRNAQQAYREIPPFIKNCVIGLFEKISLSIQQTKTHSLKYIVASARIFKMEYER